MNLYLFIGFIIVLVPLAWFSWRYFHLKDQLHRYANTLHHLARVDEFESGQIPTDVSSLEDISNATGKLIEALASRSRSAEIESARLSSVLDRMTDGVLIVDPEGIITYQNQASSRLFGSSQKAGRTLAEVVRQHQLVETWQRSQQSQATEEDTVELPFNHQFIRFMVLPDRQSQGSLLLVQNLTGVRRLETIRRDFVSNLSHELRTPLASLKALTETLRGGALEDPPVAQRFLERIETEVDALVQMAQELLDLTRIESDQVKLEKKKVDPAGLLETATERMNAQAERAGLRLKVNVTGDLPRLQVDRGRVEQVLVNLLHNAIKFTPAGGSITLAVQPANGQMLFSVRDTGTGIPQDELERVFERFYKADRARSGGGTGLGLSIARHIVEAHGGHIWAESIEGHGSTFYFTIPL